MANPLIKGFLFLILTIPVFLIGCRKEEKIDSSKIDEMIGTYYGETFYESGWSLAGGKITKLNSDTILMNYWRASSGGPIKIFVAGNKIQTKKQIFPSSGHTNNPWHVYYMVYRVSIEGYFRNDSIHFTFEEEIKREDDSDFVHFVSGRTELHKANN